LAPKTLDCAAYLSHTHKVDTAEGRSALTALSCVRSDRAGIRAWQRRGPCHCGGCARRRAGHVVAGGLCTCHAASVPGSTVLETLEEVARSRTSDAHPLAFNLRLFHNQRVLTKSPHNSRTYAAMEACNILIVPGVVLLPAPPGDALEVVATGLAIGACAGFLLVGALNWAALNRCLVQCDRSRLRRALGVARRLEVPLLVMLVAAAAASTYTYLDRGWS
jgi:hypothetical protein